MLPVSDTAPVWAEISVPVPSLSTDNVPEPPNISVLDAAELIEIVASPEPDATVADTPLSVTAMAPELPNSSALTPDASTEVVPPDWPATIVSL